MPPSNPPIQTTIPPTPNPTGLKTVINRIRDTYPDSVKIYRDLNANYQACYEIAINVNEQYKSYKRAGQRIPGIRGLLIECDAILERVHEFLRRYSSLRSSSPGFKTKFGFVSEDIGFERRRLVVCREKLVSVQRMLHGQQTMIADDAIPTVQIQDEAGQEVPVENIEQTPIPSTAQEEHLPKEPLVQDPPMQVQDAPTQDTPHRSRSQKRNARLASAAAAYKWDDVRYFIERGADVNTADSRGVRPLVYALHVKYSKRGRGEDRQAGMIVKLLLEHGAKFGMRELNELPRSGGYGEREYKKLVTKENLECDVEDSRFQSLRDI